MTYLLDTNTLIQSKDIDFPFDQYPHFWDWLLDMGTKGIITLPQNIFDELLAGQDNLSDWIVSHKDDITIQDSHGAYQELQCVLDKYGPDIQERDIEKIENDALLIAHARYCCGTVVTYEKPKNTNVPRNKKIPNICDSLGIECITFPNFIWKMFHLEE